MASTRLGKPRDSGRGEGGRASGLLGNSRRVRRDLNMIERAIREGWVSSYTMPPEEWRRLVDDVRHQIKIAKADGDARALAAGTRVMLAIAEFNLRVAEARDKADRLDREKPTEITDGTQRVVIEFDRGG